MKISEAMKIASDLIAADMEAHFEQEGHILKVSALCGGFNELAQKEVPEKMTSVEVYFSGDVKVACGAGCRGERLEGKLRGILSTTEWPELEKVTYATGQKASEFFGAADEESW